LLEGVGLTGQERSDGIDPLGEARRQFLPHRAALEHVLHLRDELAHESTPPRRPRRRPGRRGIGHREQVERRETLERADGRGDVHHQVLVGQVPAGRGVREQQVLGDHERRELGGVWLQVHRVELPAREVGPGRHVVTLPHLADVMQQGTEEQCVMVVDGRRELGGDRVGGRILEEPGHRREGAREVTVDREPVIGIALRARPHLAPRREEPLEQPDPVENVERRHAAALAAQQGQERVTGWLVPRDGFDDATVGDRVDEGRSDLAVGRCRKRLQHAGRALDLDRGRGTGAGSHPGERRPYDRVDHTRALEHRAHESIDRE